MSSTDKMTEILELIVVEQSLIFCGLLFCIVETSDPSRLKKSMMFQTLELIKQ